MLLLEKDRRTWRKTDGEQLNMGIDKRLCVVARETAEVLGISRNFAYELVKQGKLIVIKLRKRLLILRASSDRMLVESVTQYKG